MSKIGIISDIHGNIDALRATLDALDEHGVDTIYCLGDTVGYGGDPQSCCDLVRARAEATVIGNHDAAVVGAMSMDYYYDQARQALDAHRELLSEDNLKWLGELPYTHLLQEHSILLSHGSPGDPKAFDYIFHPSHVEKMLAECEDVAWLTFIGHSHLTRSFRFRAETEPTIIEDVTDDYIELRDDWSYVMTAGSVGQPRDNDARARSVVLDLDSGTVRFLRTNYNISAAARRIFERPELASEFGKRLFLGV